jgi:proline iminopeptidase
MEMSDRTAVSGSLEVDGQSVRWEVVGNPAGRAALVLHGGPGSGCDPGWLQLFDLARFRVVLMDQRGCGRSLPDAGEVTTDLSVNTTAHLISDAELLRHHLGLDRWMVVGGSWGATLALAYATSHPENVSALALFAVTTTSRREVEWATHGIGRLLPAEWERFCEGAQAADGGGLVAAYARLLADPDPVVRERAARKWCEWDDAQMRAGTARPPDPRFEDATFRLRFARLVTHYWSHAAWLPDGWALDRIDAVAGIPGVMVHGRLDLGAPLEVPWKLAKAWPSGRLVVVEGEGHGGSEIAREVASAINGPLSV